VEEQFSFRWEHERIELSIYFQSLTENIQSRKRHFRRAKEVKGKFLPFSTTNFSLVDSHRSDPMCGAYHSEANMLFRRWLPPPMVNSQFSESGGYCKPLCVNFTAVLEPRLPK